MRFSPKEVYLSFNFSLMLFINAIVLNVPWFFQTCENPKSINALLTKFNYGDLSHVVTLCTVLLQLTVTQRQVESDLAFSYCDDRQSQYEPRHDKTNKIAVRPAKTRISPGIRSVWSESSLSAWRNLGSLASHLTHSGDFDQTGHMSRLIWFFAGRTVILLFLSCRDSIINIFSILIMRKTTDQK